MRHRCAWRDPGYLPGGTEAGPARVRKLGINPQQTAVLEGDNEQQQRLEQALLTPDTEEYYNAAAL